MGTRPEAEAPKDKNITIFVTDDLRKRVDKMRKEHFSAMQMNQFTAYLVEVGLEEEGIRFKEKEIRNKARLEQASELQLYDSSLNQAAESKKAKKIG